jgi:hypothetical protein
MVTKIDPVKSEPKKGGQPPQLPEMKAARAVLAALQPLSPRMRAATLAFVSEMLTEQEAGPRQLQLMADLGVAQGNTGV